MTLSTIRLVVLAIAALFSAVVTVSGADDSDARKSAARDYFEAVVTHQNLRNELRLIGEAVAQSIAKVSPASDAGAKVYVDEMIEDVVSAYRDAFVASYAAEFTAEELAQLTIVLKVSKSSLLQRVEAHQAVFKQQTDGAIKEVRKKMIEELKVRMREHVKSSKERQG